MNTRVSYSQHLCVFVFISFSIRSSCCQYIKVFGMGEVFGVFVGAGQKYFLLRLNQYFDWPFYYFFAWRSLRRKLFQEMTSKITCRCHIIVLVILLIKKMPNTANDRGWSHTYRISYSSFEYINVKKRECHDKLNPLIISKKHWIQVRHRNQDIHTKNQYFLEWNKNERTI